MLLMVELVLLAAALAFVAYPLLKPELAESAGKAFTENELSDLLYKKDAVYTAIKDLEFDRSTGKIDDADYEEMKAGFEMEALAVLKQIDNAGKEPSAESGQDKKRKGEEGLFCVKCGAKVKADYAFCNKCGAKIE